jgi:O-antigen ligase
LRIYLIKEITFKGDSGSVRLTIWKEALEMLKTRPILGAGLAGYQTAVAPFHKAKYIEIYLYPHNIFLNFWSETGLLGLLALLWLIGVFFWQGLRSPPTHYSLLTTHYALLAAMLVILIHGLVDVPYFKNDLAVMFWILFGLVFSQTRAIKPLERDQAAHQH